MLRMNDASKRHESVPIQFAAAELKPTDVCYWFIKTLHPSKPRRLHGTVKSLSR